MRDKCTELKERYQLNYSLIATPAESLCKRFPKLDRERFGEVAGINTREILYEFQSCPSSGIIYLL